MATSNNDRVSSARLLDTLKGLQASRHLGSEPEVVTETETHESVVLFPEGQNELSVVYGKMLPVEGVPYYAYDAPITYNGQYITAPSIEGSEPVATLDVVNHYEWEQDGVSLEMYAITDFELTGSPATDQDFFDQLEDKYVFFWTPMGGGMRAFFYGEPDFTNLSNMVVGKTSEYTTTTTTKTKRPIKQDYVPNADWNQNDPDGEGYVEGRTHWVEESVTEVIPSAGTYNLEEFQAALNSVEPSVVYVCDEYNAATFPATMPEYTGEPVAVLDKEFNVSGLRVLGPSDWDGDIVNPPEYLFIFKQLPYYQANTVMSVTNAKYYRWKAVAEMAHKLPTKFINRDELAIPDIKITNEGATVDDTPINTYPKAYVLLYKNPNGNFIDNLIIIPITNIYQAGMWYCKLRVSIGTYNENNGSYSNTSEQYLTNTDTDLYELIKRQLGYTEDETFEIQVYKNVGVAAFGEADNHVGNHDVYIGRIMITIEMDKTNTKTTIEHEVITNEQVSSGMVRPVFHVEGLFDISVTTI